MKWEQNSQKYFVKTGNKTWLEFNQRAATESYTEKSMEGADLNLVVVLQRDSDGLYVILREGEAKSSTRLSTIEKGTSRTGNWKRAQSTTTTTTNQNEGSKNIKSLKNMVKVVFFF